MEKLLKTKHRDLLFFIVSLFLCCLALTGCALLQSLLGSTDTSAEDTLPSDSTQGLDLTGTPSSELEQWIADLAFGDVGAREAAVESLVALGPQAVEPLITVMRDGNSSEQMGAAEVLGRIGDPRALDVLIAALQDDFSLVREKAAEALGLMGDARAVEPLIAVLRDENSEAQEQAAKALGQIGDSRAVEPLIDALYAEDPFAREQAIFALGKLKDPRAVEPLMRLFEKGDSLDQYYAEQALVMVGAPSVDSLILALQNADRFIQTRAVTALGEIKDPRAAEPLAAYLRTADDQIPVYQALVNIGEPAVDVLIAALQEDDIEVSGYAAKALGEIRDPRAVDPLIAALSREDFYYKGWAAIALGQIGDPRAIEPLIASMKGYERATQGPAKDALVMFGDPAVEPLIAALKNEDAGIRQWSVLALGEIKDLRAVDPLIAVLSDEDFYVRIEVPMVLAGFEDPRVLPPLLGALQDTQWSRVRMNAADALAELKDPAAVEPLIAALQDEDSYVRRQVALALGAIGDPKAVDPLLAALDDNDPVAAMAAAEALSWFDDPRSLDALSLALNEGDLPVIAGAYEYYIRLGQVGSETLLIDALNAFGSIPMGEDYLNCGNAELSKAAEEWASSKGYTITTYPGASDYPRWGSNP